jgi:hypothetical protein
MKRYLAALAALVLGLAACLFMITTTAAPANATISFCKVAKNAPCSSPINGCSLALGNGGYAFAEDGDSIVNGAGIKMTCVKGKWVRASRDIGPEIILPGHVGGGVFFQGPPGPITVPDCDVLLTCPIG